MATMWRIPGSFSGTGGPDLIRGRVVHSSSLRWVALNGIC
jgi:hypothetical protein